MKDKKNGNKKAAPSGRSATESAPDCLWQAANLLCVYSGILSELNRSNSSSSFGPRENVRF